MSAEQIFQPVTAAALVEQTRGLKQAGWRLVQISATRLPEGVELTYSFDLESRLSNLRLLAAATDQVPSISSVFWCAVLYENEIHDLFGLQIEGIAVDFKGNLYQTTVKHPFGSTQAPAQPASPAKPASTIKPTPPSVPA
ncbi:MAG TPA: NADH-quinone oxidoreductase subunit C [Clostridia bacterium]|nr:NADH-quinone oxidoreductase subunit C [Clostridia bacterium]